MIILLLSVQDLALILILQTVMFIRCTSPVQTNVFSSRPTAVNKVFSLLNKLNKSRATGLDKISARLIRKCADLICIPICDIFNQSISLGIFPDYWKCARVTLLFKQGDREDLNKLLPSFCDLSWDQGVWNNCLWSITCLFRRTRHLP